MKSRLYTVFFTVAVTAVFGLVVSGLNSVLAGKKLINSMVKQQSTILDLFGNPEKPVKDSTPEEVIDRFARIISKVEFKDSSGKESAYFTLADAPEATAVFPLKGQGFWDAIHGFIALDLSEKKITGIRFTQHGETPGLGGRISEPAFSERFVGVSIPEKGPDGRRLKFVSEGAPRAAAWEIDGITGATGTTTSLERILNNSLDEIVEILSKRGSK